MGFFNFFTQPAYSAQRRQVLLVLVTLAITGAPQLWRMPLTLSATAVVFLLIKLALLFAKRRLRAWLLWALTFFYLALVLIFYGGISGAAAGGALLMGMLCLKLLEAANLRDFYLAVFLAYFLIALNFLSEQAIGFAVLGALQLILINFVLSAISAASSQLAVQKRLKFAALVTLQAAPLMLLLFLLFPRIQGPLWALPKQSQRAQTGFSETMQPGTVAHLAQTAGTAFRVKFANNLQPPKHLLYFRALTLWHYDGYTWSQAPTYQRLKPAPAAYIQANSTPIDYQITLEPHGKRALFVLDMPLSFRATSRDRLRINSAAELSRLLPIDAVFAYQVRSVLDYQLEVELDRQARLLALQLPANSNPRTLALGQSLASRAIGRKNPSDWIINETLTQFGQRFSYTLNPPPVGKDKADGFLFDTQAGFCEDYAGAMTLLLRAAGIPARVVVGYQGGDYNNLTGELIVRQADAHAWVEAWIEKKGWVRLDPTAQVSPERIDASLEAALPEQADQLALLSRRHASQLIRLSADMLDAIDSYWNNWVLGFGPELQQQIMQKLGLKNLYQMLLALIGGASLILLLGFVWILRAAHRPKNPADKIMQKLYRASQQPCPAYMPLGDYLAHLGGQYPAVQPALLHLGALYNQIQYRLPNRHANGRLLAELKSQCRHCAQQIKAQKRHHRQKKSANQNNPAI